MAATAALLPDRSDFTPEERIVWFCISATWLFYFAGALYIMAPVVGWLLTLLLVARKYLTPEDGPERSQVVMPFGVMLWIAGMLMMEVALIMGHLDFALGVPSLIKSSIGWAKGWALLALFPAIGAGLFIRPALFYRLSCIVGLHVLLLLPVFILAFLLRLPQQLYVSPLQIVGGPGPEFFSVTLYNIDATTGDARWRFFTPWAPAAGFVANIYFVLALQERSRRWRWIGLIAWTLVAILSKSRLALVVLLLAWPLTLLLSNLTRPRAVIALGSVVALAGLVGGALMDLFTTVMDAFTAARPESSRVRATLGRMAVDRWQGEALIWGHGVVETGPHIVERMPIGSHHSWYGLLFVKGIVGFLALAIPLAWTVVEMLVRAQKDHTARVALSLSIMLVFYTFAENLEILAYLLWPALMFIGIAMRGERVPRAAGLQCTPA
ncbi:hypothetical protein ABLE93_20745 [Xanthobacter sp. KR7-65]|uniref:hypothetical protein n=1 Tax=Xanthobacter sp. KR7-65 TaxID=3156612 RepID=UPI0032B3D711